MIKPTYGIERERKEIWRRIIKDLRREELHREDQHKGDLRREDLRKEDPRRGDLHRADLLLIVHHQEADPILPMVHGRNPERRKQPKLFFSLWRS